MRELIVRNCSRYVLGLGQGKGGEGTPVRHEPPAAAGFAGS